MQTSFYDKSELEQIGFKSLGEDVKVSRFARFYGINQISIGNNVRIDDFCLLSGNIILKNNIHISAFCALYGQGSIYLDDYSGLSPRCILLSASDDFSGNFLIGPQNKIELTNVEKGRIFLNRFCQLGANTIVLPNVEIGEGSVTGVMSFVKNSLNEWGIYAGAPAIFLKARSKNLLNYI